MKNQSWFTHPQVISNQFEFLSSAEPQRRDLEEYLYIFSI